MYSYIEKDDIFYTLKHIYIYIHIYIHIYPYIDMDMTIIEWWAALVKNSGNVLASFHENSRSPEIPMWVLSYFCSIFLIHVITTSVWLPGSFRKLSMRWDLGQPNSVLSESSSLCTSKTSFLIKSWLRSTRRLKESRKHQTPWRSWPTRTPWRCWACSALCCR